MYSLDMKREGYIVVSIILLISIGLAYAAPPSFHIFSGNVHCENDPLTPLVTYAISATADNGTHSFDVDGSVSDEGEYFFIIDADPTYTIYFYIDSVEVGSSAYTMFGITNDLDFTTSSELYCGAPPVCGDDVVEDPEDCEEDDLDGATCGSLGYSGGGNLACATDCSFNTTNCVAGPDDTICGDDVAEGDEGCDGADLKGNDCSSLGYDSGDLACNSDCTFNENNCETGGGVITFPVSPYGDLAFWSTISLFVVILGVLGYLFYDKFRKKPVKKIPKKLPSKVSKKLAKK